MVNVFAYAAVNVFAYAATYKLGRGPACIQVGVCIVGGYLCDNIGMYVIRK